MSQGKDHGDDARAVWYALVVQGGQSNASAARVLDVHRSVTNRWKRGNALARAQGAYQARAADGTLAALVKGYTARSDAREAGEQAAANLEAAGRLTRDVPGVTSIDEAFGAAVVVIAECGAAPAVALMSQGVPQLDAEEWVRQARDEDADSVRWAQMTTALAVWEIARRKAAQNGERGAHADLLRTTIPERYTPQERVEVSRAFEEDAEAFAALNAEYGADPSG